MTNIIQTRNRLQAIVRADLLSATDAIQQFIGYIRALEDMEVLNMLEAKKFIDNFSKEILSY